MSYKVLARKWRPRSFKELVGQEHVSQTLVNSLSEERMHHAYLFTGTRGVGKTTVARILAKSLNCNDGVTPSPCQKCEACTSIDDGRFIDLIEVDAASRTKVEQTRELLENVQYAPTNGRYKVYLIDEVHMLSSSSFNALLKTLEEPPEHVKFLLATTESSKIPVTVLSRCLQFNLKAISIDNIQKQLIKISKDEGFDIGSSSLRPLAIAANGSMRDALSLLDQAVAYSGGTITDDALNKMLGTIDKNNVFRLIEAVSSSDGKRLMKEIDALDDHSPDYCLALDQFMVTLQKIAVIQLIGPEDSDDTEQLTRIASTLSEEDTQLYYQIALNGIRDLAFCKDIRSGFEMTMLRMLAFRPSFSADIDVPDSLIEDGTKSALQENAETKLKANHKPYQKKSTIDLSDLNVSGAAKLLVDNSNIVSMSNESVELVVSEKNSHLGNPEVVKILERSIKEKYNKKFIVTVSIGTTDRPTNMDKKNNKYEKINNEAKEAIFSDPNIKAIEDEFNAVIDSDTIKPN